MFRGGIGPTEILLILLVVVVLFGGRKLPELARGSGRALRIFKSEVQELQDDKKSDRDAIEPVDDDTTATTTRPEQQPRSTPHEQG